MVFRIIRISFEEKKDVLKQLKLVLKDCGITLWGSLAPQSSVSVIVSDLLDPTSFSSEEETKILVGTFSNSAPFYTTGSVGEHSLGRFSMSSLLNYYSNYMTEKQIHWYKIFIKL